MGLFMYVTENDIKRMSTVSDKELNELLQEARKLNPNILISERQIEIPRFFRKYKKITEYQLFYNCGFDAQYIFAAGKDKESIESYLYGFINGCLTEQNKKQEYVSGVDPYEDDSTNSTAHQKNTNEIKSLKIGYWYKAKNVENQLVFNKDSKGGYGIVDDIWDDYYSCSKVDEWTEASSEEVKQALINEAKKRNIIEGYHITDLNNVSIVPNGEYVYSNGTLYLGGATIFKDGEWAEIIESTKIETGNWYKNETSLMYSVDGINAYGIVNGDWIENGKCYGDEWTKLSLEDAHKELLEFIKKFYSIGDVVECASKNTDIRKITKYEHPELDITIGEGQFWSISNGLGICIMKDGKFARKLQKVGV